tara:strand:+ start:327 stop:1742 length:1416 start_codon:yes stop_codon:yes gene_type:complete
MNFKEAVLDTTVPARTANGMATFESSLSACVDLFFNIGASRGRDVRSQFERAFAQDPEIALKILLWVRDVRGGAGERQLFRDLLVNLEEFHFPLLKNILDKVPELGRWDDLLVLKTTAGRQIAFNIIQEALRDGNGLAAKWMPRKGPNSVLLRKHMAMSPKQYRKTLVGLTAVVETQMCAKEWEEINFSHVPSVASSRYMTAFHRNAPVAYTAYKEALTKNDGTAKVNAGAVYPYDILKLLKQWSWHDKHDRQLPVIKAQWEALPNYIGDDLVLPMVDVSGSMGCPVGGGGSLTCMDIALSLGLYLADKNTGPYKDMFLTFSKKSKIEVLKGDIIQKYNQLVRADWDMDTNLHAAFEEILRVATAQSLKDSDMPKYMLILSDMEFNSCVEHDDRAMRMIERRFEAAGYTVPKIVFWNIRASGKAPVRFDQEGTALVSGFSPAIMTSILAAENFTPTGIMMETLSSPRYDLS